MHIAIFGTGYVGLVTGTCFAEMGHTVTCVDVNEKKIEKLNQGIIPIYEPGLKELVIRNKESKRLFFTTSYEIALNKAEVCFIAVPTPSADDGSCDLSYVVECSKLIAKNLKSSIVVINKSTSPVKTGDLIEKVIKWFILGNFLLQLDHHQNFFQNLDIHDLGDDSLYHDY